MDTAILQRLPEPYLLVDTASRVLAANAAITDLSYRTSDEWALAHLTDGLRFDHEDDSTLFAQLVAHPPAEPWQAPAWVWRKDGTWVPVHIWLAAVDGATESTCLLRLTHRKQKMQEVAIENTMDGVALLDKDGHYYYLNDAHIKLFSYEAEDELLGKTWHAIYPPQEIERIEAEVFRQLNEKGTYRGETLGQGKDGAPVFQEITLTALEDGGMVCVCRDISERKHYQAELHKQALVARHTGALVAITDPEGRVEWVNDSFEINTGYTLDEMKGHKPGHILQGPDTDPATVAAIRQALDNTSSFEGEILNYTKAGQPYWIYLSITPLFDDFGQLRNYMAVQTVITDIREANERMEKALQKERELNESKSKFISLTSHEFRTPMTGIQLSADLLSRYLEKIEQPALQQVMDQQVQRIADEVDHMKEVLDNILNLGRIEAGKLEADPQPIQLHVLTQELLEEYLAVNHRGREAHYTWKGTPRTCRLDSRLMGHVVRNLISNALKYSAEEDVPTVQVTYETATVQLRVTDRGIGIPRKDVPHLFTSFFRAENVGTRKGTGLGLVLVKQFVEWQGGTLAVQTEEGKGSTFTITFPYGT